MYAKKLFKYVALICLILSANVWAVTEEDFKVKTTQNLLNLCTASSDDPQYQEAIHFCHGYLVGAYHYYAAENKGPDSQKLVCFPEPKPTRNEAIDKVVNWAKQHPEFMNELPVETEFRALTDLWPCQKTIILAP